MTPTTLFDLPTAIPPHPAPYTNALYPAFVQMLRGCRRLLDPFGGKGGIFELAPWLPGCEIEAVELEPEWANAHPRLTLGNALALPWPDGYFDAVCTSPCYGNRMADHHEAKDASKRLTYRHYLGRPLHPDNAGAMEWGLSNQAYEQFHVKAWREAARVLQPGGRFVLNVKDFYRDFKPQPVTQWHVDTLQGRGFAVVDWQRIKTPGMRFGANGQKRMEYESVILFRKVTP